MEKKKCRNTQFGRSRLTGCVARIKKRQKAKLLANGEEIIRHIKAHTTHDNFSWALAIFMHIWWFALSSPFDCPLYFERHRHTLLLSHTFRFVNTRVRAHTKAPSQYEFIVDCVCLMSNIPSPVWPLAQSLLGRVYLLFFFSLWINCIIAFHERARFSQRGHRREKKKKNNITSRCVLSSQLVNRANTSKSAHSTHMKTATTKNRECRVVIDYAINVLTDLSLM